MKDLNDKLFAYSCHYYSPRPAVQHLPSIRSGLPGRKDAHSRRPKGNPEPSVEEDEGVRRPEIQLTF